MLLLKFQNYSENPKECEGKFAVRIPIQSLRFEFRFHDNIFKQCTRPFDSLQLTFKRQMSLNRADIHHRRTKLNSCLRF